MGATIYFSDHRFYRIFSGFWIEDTKLIHESANKVPFMIKNGKHGVEIIDGLSAAVLDLDIVYNSYLPLTLSKIDHIFGFFSGVRQKGLQRTELILREGSLMTAVGEIELAGKTLRMQASDAGPILLTNLDRATLLEQLEEKKEGAGGAVVLCTIVFSVILWFIWKKVCKKKKQEEDERKIKETLEKSRKERRAKTRTVNLNVKQNCRVCKINPKEIIIFPCGHVCLCEDCSEIIELYCPVCRNRIESKAPAFIS